MNDSHNINNSNFIENTTGIEMPESYIINITEFIPFDYGQQIKYRILGICTHYGSSGRYGHYVAFCRNRDTDKWYEFNDSSCSEVKDKKRIYGGSPYLLLYERFFQ